MTLVDTGHDDRPVAVVDTAGGTVIAKHYRTADAGAIWQLHLDLWNSSFGARRDPPGIPQPLSFDPSRSLVTMEHVGGRPVGRRGDLGDTVAVARPAARLLADLHRSRIAPTTCRTNRSIVRSVHRKAFEFDDPMLGDLAYRAARRMTAMRLEDEHLVPSHGDFSPRNVLAGPDGLRLIDLDRMQLAPRGRDLAYWGAWAWATELQIGRASPDWSIGDRFITEYSLVCPSVLRELDRSLGFHRAAALIRIAHGWTALRPRPDLVEAILCEALVQLDE
ncbi:MAG: phosphotransferase [Ilumatobacteraceae bacterium]